MLMYGMKLGRSQVQWGAESSPRPGYVIVKTYLNARRSGQAVTWRPSLPLRRCTHKNDHHPRSYTSSLRQVMGGMLAGDAGALPPALPASFGDRRGDLGHAQAAGIDRVIGAGG